MTDELNAAWRDIRARMQEVALPDSRFDMDLDSFIPAFGGVHAASEVVAARSEFAAAGVVFITPDNSMQALRHLALTSGKIILIPTYGLKRGFLKLDPATFAPELALYASWGDGGEHFGTFVPIAALGEIGAIDLCLVGAAAVSTNGLRFGMGHRYFDVEWNIFRNFGLVSEATPIWTVVHDHQVADVAGQGGTEDVRVDISFTPTRVIDTPQRSRPTELRPETLDQLFAGAPPRAVAEAVRLAGVVG